MPALVVKCRPCKGSGISPANEKHCCPACEGYGEVLTKEGRRLEKFVQWLNDYSRPEAAEKLAHNGGLEFSPLPKRRKVTFKFWS